MSSAGLHSGIYGAAMVRAAEAMLQSLGGDTIALLFPAAILPNDPSAQLGLVDPGVQELYLSPVVVRNLITPPTGPRRRIEFLISATAVSGALAAQNVGTAEELFNGALGIAFDGSMFHIEQVATESFAGAEYLYRVTAVE